MSDFEKRFLELENRMLKWERGQYITDVKSLESKLDNLISLMGNGNTNPQSQFKNNQGFTSNPSGQ